MARAIAMLAVLWPAVAGAAVLAEAAGSPHAWTTGVYLVGGRVCHQRPERSFHTSGVAWPVCARCSGIYLGAAAGAWLGALVALRRWTRDAGVRAMLAFASLPTALTWIAERAFDVPMTNTLRFVAALPLGLAIAAVVVATASRVPKANQVN
jgi:uncharacterized membrane protein